MRTIELKLGNFRKFIKDRMIHHRMGKHCFFIKHKGKGLRVFHSYPLKDWRGLKTFRWGDPKIGGAPDRSCLLVDATKIQNIAWMYDLAPRVYEIVKVKVGKKKYWGQVLDDVGDQFVKNHDDALGIYNEVRELGAYYGFINEKADVSKWDVVIYKGKHKLVDFNTFHFDDTYKQKLAKKYSEVGRYGAKYYHSIPELGLTQGPRQNEKRIIWMQLDQLDFKNKSVLDIGCAGGYFCRYAKSRGASDVVGVDYPDVKNTDPTFGARLISNELCYWNIDYVELDLTKNFIDEKFDYTFFFSMSYHVPNVLELLSRMTKELCIVEDNSRMRNADVTLKKFFKKVELRGLVTDRGESTDRALKVFYCYPR